MYCLAFTYLGDAEGVTWCYDGRIFVVLKKIERKFDKNFMTLIILSKLCKMNCLNFSVMKFGNKNR